MEQGYANTIHKSLPPDHKLSKILIQRLKTELMLINEEINLKEYQRLIQYLEFLENEEVRCLR